MARTLTSVLIAAGLVVFFVLFAVLVWTRFGQARPISKCIALSLLAHVLLLIYAYGTHILYGPPGSWTGRAVTVRIRDAADDIEAAPTVSATPKQWQQPGESNAPLLLASPEDHKDDKMPDPSPPAPEPASPPAIASAPPVESQPPSSAQPDLANLLPDGPSPVVSTS